jgi:hypothetical protein
VATGRQPSGCGLAGKGASPQERMRKLIFMSLWVAPVILAIRTAADGNPRRGLNRTVLWTFAFIVLWVLLAPRVE